VTRALLLHSDADALLPFLRERCDGADWRVATDACALATALDEHAPEVVFSIKHNDLPGPVHAPALAHPSVRWFHVGGSGRDHLGAWDPMRVAVTTCAGVLAPFHAERALAALLSIATGLPAFARAQARSRWEPATFRPLAGRTLVVVGLGHTGGQLARRAAALGVRVLGVRASAGARPGNYDDACDAVRGADALDALLPEADALSLNVPANAATRGLIDARRLALLPDGAIVLNGARGSVLDEAALVAALDAGRLAGAWLDVFATEPLPPSSPLWSHARVLVTPHCADQADDWPRRFAERFAENWRRRRAGEPLVGVVEP